MSTVANYSFLPWLRQGLAGQVTATDGDNNVHGRAEVGVALTLSGEPTAGGPPATVAVQRQVQIYGPGDVVGIDAREVIRADPRDWITNAEPNYLAHIEFYDEDFPWRYTPAGPDGTGLRLRPWVALLVLEEGTEFEDVRAHGDRPLPGIDVLNPAALPVADELWAWAHVHVNTSLAGPAEEMTSTDMTAVLPRLSAALGANRDIAYSRLVCPRRLRPDAQYHAFVVPTFEPGRLAGLGLDPAGSPFATTSSWAAYPGKPAPATLPVYHRWYFRTGSQGDFEYLVRLLKPRAVDSRVGRRDIDVRHPDGNLRGVTDPVLGGVLRLGGALRTPESSLTAEERATAEQYENWDQSPPAALPYPQPFQQDLAALINLPEDYTQRTAAAANAGSGLPAITGHPDPLITAPLYGRWHALTRRLLTEQDGSPSDPLDNWVHELNLDPRHRGTAGFGTKVLQANQENYMEAAWGQIGDVLDANRRIRQARLAQLVAQSWWTQQLAGPLVGQPERSLALVAPARRHILLSAGAVPLNAAAAGPQPPVATLQHRLAVSAVTPTLVSAPLRRVARPRARLVRNLPEITSGTLLARVDAGEVAAAPPLVTPDGLVTTDELADVATPPLPSWIPAGIRSWLLDLLRRIPRLPLLMLAAGMLLVLIGLLVLLGIPVFGVLLVLVGLVVAAIGWALRNHLVQLARADALRPDGLTVSAVDGLPAAPGFEIVPFGTEPRPAGGGVGDSPTATRFKGALRDWHRLHEASAQVGVVADPVRYGPDGLAQLAGGAIAAVDPAITVPRRTGASLTLPAHLIAGLTEEFGEVMAYPRVDQPMYEPLKALSDELFVPNLNLIPQNTITLMETNQPFIEAYMVGVNHEMARELLWREYPTDQRGTPFRQFWDVRGARPAPGLSADQARESLYDIPPLHLWAKRSFLGDHDHRELPGENEQEAVLAVRGELLKKYPNAVIYAHRAEWGRTGGRIDPGKERTLVVLTAEQEANPPSDTVKTPLFEARVTPDITFFGFDLTVSEARGGAGEQPTDPPGWFFCIKERPGEPRFGFDVERDGQVQTVNDLAWSDAGVAEGAQLSGTSLGTVALAPLGPGDLEKTEQRADDLQVVGAPISAARWAYLLYQSPVLVAVHAAEMLPH